MTRTKVVIGGWFSDFPNPSILRGALNSRTPQQGQ